MTTPKAKAAPKTLREALEIKDDIRVSGFQFNPWTGQLMFGADEGIKGEDGFTVTRSIPGVFTLTDQDYKDFLNLKSDEGETVVATMKRFLTKKLGETLDKALPKPQAPEA